MRLTSNISIAAHTFEAWIEKVNEIAYLFSTLAVTVESNTTGATTTGNAHVLGTFGANNLFANGSLRGGNTSTSANLTVTSNTIFDTTANVWFNGTTVTSPANLAISGNIVHTGIVLSSSANASLTGANLSVTGTNANFTSNLNVSGAMVKFSGATVNVSGTTFNVSANVIASGANISVVATNVAITGNLNILGTTGITNFAGASFLSSANVTLSGANVVISGTNTNITANATITGLTTLTTVNTTSTSELRGVATAYANIIASSNAAVVQVGRATGRFQFFGNNADFTGTVNVAGISTFSGNVVAPTVNATALIIGANPYEYQGISNTDLGNDTTANVLITRFPVATYRAGKVGLWFNTSANNSQVAEIWFTTNTSSVDYTVSGVLYNSATQPVTLLSANLNGANVEIYGKQAVANTYVKGIAELIRG